MLQKLLFYLKVSRPGLWFVTLWLYLLPTSQLEHIWSSSTFWYGFFYATFPLNFMVYGWNDMVDIETDQINPRKDSFLFGAKGTSTQLETLWKPILVLQIIFVPYLFKNGLRSRPPLELLCQVGYLMIVPFSMFLNDLPDLPALTYFYLLLFAWQSHLIGEVMDIIPDKKAGRTTTAIVLGMKKTKILIICIVALEVFLLVYAYGDYVFGGMLAMALIWLLIDLFLLFKTQTYSLVQMKIFGVLSNLVAVSSMGYVWYSGCLLKTVF